MIIGMVFFLAGFGALSLIGEWNMLVHVSVSLVSIAFALVNVQTLVTILEMTDDADVGRFTGIYYTCFMGGQILAPILAGAVLETLGYQYLCVYSFLVAIVVLIMLLFVRHGDAKPVMKGTCWRP